MGLKDWFRKQKIRILISQLDSNDKAVAKLVGLGADAVPALIEALKDENFHTKASRALVGIGEAAVLPLIEALRHTDAEIRSNACLTLGWIGDIRAVEPLIEALKSGTLEQESAEALGDITDIRAVPVLIEALGDDDSEVRWSAARALGKIEDEKIVPLLKRALEDEDGNKRYSAAEVLGHIGDVEVVPALTDALKDDDDRVRYFTSKALAKIIPDSGMGLAEFGLVLRKFVERERKDGDEQKLWRAKREAARGYKKVAAAVAKRKNAQMDETLPAKIKPPKPGNKEMYRAGSRPRMVS